MRNFLHKTYLAVDIPFFSKLELKYYVVDKRIHMYVRMEIRREKCVYVA